MDGDFNVVWWKNYIGLLNQRICKIDSGSDKLDKYYVYYQLIEAVKFVNNITPQTTVKHLSTKDIENLKIPLPPLPEQRRIAEILSTVDETIERTGALIEKYRNIKSGLMADLLTRGIDEEGRIRSEETHRFRDSALGALPEEWEVVRLGGISNIKMGQSPPSSSYNNSSDGLPFFQGNADFGTKFPIVRSYCNEPLKIADVDDILISVRAPVGAINISNVRCCIGRGLAAISADENNSQAFMYYLLQSCVATLNKFASGSTFTAINQKELNSLLILCPPLPEQRRIAELLTTADQRIEKEEAYRNKLLQLKKGLMQDLLTGRVRVKVPQEAVA